MCLFLILIFFPSLLRELQRATSNFTTKLGEGAFGPVYKAVMPEGGMFAVKVLSSQSRQGEKEFLNEVFDFCTFKGNIFFVLWMET